MFRGEKDLGAAMSGRHTAQSIRSVQSQSSISHEILEKLDRSQRKLLKDTFQCLEENITHNGLHIFLNMFQDYPTYKNLFPQLRNVSDSVLMDSPVMRSAAVNMMNGLRGIIGALDDEQKLFIILSKISKTHAQKHVFKKHLENMLPGVLGLLKTAGKLDDQCEMAWRTLFDVVSELTDQFREDLNK